MLTNQGPESAGLGRDARLFLNPISWLDFLPLTRRMSSHLYPGTEPGQSSPMGEAPSRYPAGNPAEIRVLSAYGQQGAQLHTAVPTDYVPCWPPCTGRSTAACHSCPRTPWARSSRCSRGRRELQEGHSRMKQGEKHCPAGKSFYVTSTLNLLGVVGGLPNFHYQTTSLHFLPWILGIERLHLIRIFIPVP